MKFRKKPVEIEAIQFIGTERSDAECLKFCPAAIDPVERGPSLIIPTPYGEMRVSVGDWIIRMTNGEFYPCKPEIFEMTYEKVE